MCRLLYVNTKHETEIEKYLYHFSLISKNSKEYQGHGWGCAYFQNNEWKYYKNIKPIWEDNISQFGKATRIIAHARSAFKDEGIVIENNMPFYDDKNIFVFNGELRGVKIKEEGRIGAEKIFNFIKRFDKGNFFDALKKGTDIIIKKSNYVRAMNIIITSTKNSALLFTFYNEDEDYFQMWKKQNHDELIICSQPFSLDIEWEPINNNSILEFKCI
ncbi:MAG: class II glutamine amidotransferase [Melioribacteraceae bacterium]|nr:class II glutamine amidotransferase [Melioribacteraceae bacterium]